MWGPRRVEVLFVFLLSPSTAFLVVKAWLEGSNMHVSATSSNIVESNMLHSFGHHVAVFFFFLPFLFPYISLSANGKLKPEKLNLFYF